MIQPSSSRKRRGGAAGNNLPDGNLFGIVLHGADQAMVKGNSIFSRGDGTHLLAVAHVPPVGGQGVNHAGRGHHE
jgi:hypothetical protein